MTFRLVPTLVLVTLIIIAVFGGGAHHHRLDAVDQGHLRDGAFQDGLAELQVLEVGATVVLAGGQHGRVERDASPLRPLGRLVRPAQLRRVARR